MVRQLGPPIYRGGPSRCPDGPGERLNEALFAIREADHREGRAPVDATTRIEASIDQEVFWDADFSAYAGEEEDYSHNVSDRD